MPRNLKGKYWCLFQDCRWWLFSARNGQNVGYVARTRQQTFATQDINGRVKVGGAWKNRQPIRMMRDHLFISAPCLRFRRRLSVRNSVNRLLVAGYRSRRPARCHRLTFGHRRRRRGCGNMHRRWDLRHWRHCVFSGESRFTLFHSVRRARVCRRQGERLIDARISLTDGNCGPSAPWWEEWTGGAGRGALNCQRYNRLLVNVFPWVRGILGWNFVYTQNNATPHTAHDTTFFLAHQDVKVMDWPARSPDMNPIEYIWGQMGVWIRDMDESSFPVPEPRRVVLQTWAAVRPRGIGTLVESMPRHKGY